MSLANDPGGAEAHLWPGRASSETGDIDDTREAVDHVLTAYRIQPGAPAVVQILVWVLAPHDDPKLPSAEETTAMAEKMAAATRTESAAILDILAASYARGGRFQEAAHSASRAIKLAKKSKADELAAGIQARLSLYESGTPYLK